MTTPNTPYSTSNTAGIDFYATYTPPAAGQELYLTPAPFAVGTIADGTGGSKWMYVVYSTGGTTGAGYVVVVDKTFTAVMMSNSVGAFGDKIGVPQHGAAASGDYGWVQMYGQCQACRFNGAAVVNTALASTTTAGALDDATTSGTKNLPGIVATQTVTGAGNFTAELNWPTVGTTN